MVIAYRDKKVRVFVPFFRAPFTQLFAEISTVFTTGTMEVMAKV
jgi:hypothetical protein